MCRPKPSREFGGQKQRMLVAPHLSLARRMLARLSESLFLSSSSSTAYRPVVTSSAAMTRPRRPLCAVCETSPLMTTAAPTENVPHTALCAAQSADWHASEQ